MSRVLTIDELRAIVQELAKVHLEIERGLRSKDVLADRMPPGARLVFRRSHTPQTRLSGGTVTNRDVRRVRVERHDSGRVYASAVTSTNPGQIGSLSFVLQTRARKVALLQVQRIHARRDYTRDDNSTRQQQPSDQDRQLTIARENRDHADAARQDLARRIATTAKGDPKRTTLARAFANWTRLVDHLDREVTELTRRHQQHQHMSQQRQPRHPSRVRRRE